MDTTIGDAPDTARADRPDDPDAHGREEPDGVPDPSGPEARSGPDGWSDPDGPGDPGGPVAPKAPVGTTACVVRPRRGVTDPLGVAVLVCWAIWALVAAAGRPARPEGTLLALLAITAGYAAGRILGALLPVVAPAIAAVVVLALATIPPSRLSARPDAPPLGYANADAALLVLAVGAACCAAWATHDRAWRTGLRLIGLGAAVAALALGSAVGFAAGIAITLCSLAAGRIHRRLPGIVGLALAALLTVGGTYAVAVDGLPSGLSTPTAGRLTQSRVELWHEAASLAERHPLRGVGPGQFADESTALSSDMPAAESPRSAPLQLAAEQGLPGVALLAGAYGWLLCALWRSSRPTPVVLTAAVTLTALALLASADDILGYAAVTAAAGYLAGIATARPLEDDGGGDSALG